MAGLSDPLSALLVLPPGDRERRRPLHARQDDLQELTDFRHRGRDAISPHFRCTDFRKARASMANVT